MEIFLLLLILTIWTWYSVRIYFRRSAITSTSPWKNLLGIDKELFFHWLETLTIHQSDVRSITDILSQKMYWQWYSTMLVAALLAQGHVIIQWPPGTWKTSLVKALSQACDLSYARIQCTPDLLPQDVLWLEILDKNTHTLVHNPWPIFANVVHVDEINRTTPKLQSAFLEAMQEWQTTLFWKTYPLPHPFFLVATQNPYDAMWTYLLPYAQVDRFMIWITTTYLSAEKEVELIRNSDAWDEFIGMKVTSDTILSMIEHVEKVTVSDDILEYAVACTQQCKNAWFSLSVRSSKSLLSFAKSLAYMQWATIVTKQDIVMAILPVVKHRIDYILWTTISEEKIYDIMTWSLQKDDIGA